MQPYGFHPYNVHPQSSSSPAFSTVAATLANPYGAYPSTCIQRQTTLEGYTISSTYTPSLSLPSVASRQNRPTQPNSRQHSTNAQSSGSWYQPGNNKCSYPGCNFSGSYKALEIHKMDRHLIYPPGWEKKKLKSDWDADPSLKGKPIPIQGTTLFLDTPEALNAWLAERKRRWPTIRRIDEKKLKMEDAIARGQLSPGDSSFHSRKRRRLNESSVQRVREENRSIPNVRQKGRSLTCPATHQPSPTSKRTCAPSNSSPEVTSDDDDKPEVISSKQEPRTFQTHNFISSGISEDNRGVRRPHIHQPKREPPNPFASRPALLRNLLLPEIRMTISNLSQAIRFLVDNDFLRNVELKAGEAEDDKIQVISESRAMAS